MVHSSSYRILFRLIGTEFIVVVGFLFWTLKLHFFSINDIVCFGLLNKTYTYVNFVIFHAKYYIFSRKQDNGLLSPF